VNSADHTTLVAAVKAAGLVDTLEGAGPFTVFAPTNEAFAKLPAGTVETLLKPENKATLTKVLTYHVVSGRLSASDVKKQIKAGNGRAELTTVEGGKLWASMQDGNRIILKDEKGGTALVTIPNVFQSNGVIHIIDSVVWVIRISVGVDLGLSTASGQSRRTIAVRHFSIAPGAPRLCRKCRSSAGRYRPLPATDPDCYFR
jgi:uncharacterized surface protein with fasciclin (FAS1) repeats